MDKLKERYSGVTTARKWRGVVPLLLLFGFSLRAQQPTPDAASNSAPPALKTGPYRIAGRVVSAVDGRPLPGATVVIGTVLGGRLVGSAVAGDMGRFACEGLAAGKYTLLGEMRGFLSANYDQHEQFSTAIVTGAGVGTEVLVLRLKPAAAVAGRVLDEFGEPVRRATVTLYGETHATGKRKIAQVRALSTDDRGEYALGELPDGRYFLTVRATPWYAVNSHTFDPGPQSSLSTGVDPALDVTYPLTYFGDVTDGDAATPILLTPGEQMRADVHMRPVKALRIMLPTSPGNAGVVMPALRMKVFDGFDQVMSQGLSGPSGAMEIVGLAPGLYQLEQSDPKTGASTALSSLDLTHGSVEVQSAQGEAPATMTVSLEQQDGSKLPTQMQVMIRGRASSFQGGQGLDPKGEATFAGLPPGEYDPVVYGANRVWQIVRIEQDGKRLAGDRLRIAPGETAAVKLLIADAAVTIEGVALRDNKPAPGAMIVLVPVDAIDRPEMFRRDQSDLDGTFVLPDVIPGRYIVIAIDDGWKLEWGKAEVLTRYLVKGVVAQIAASQRRTMRLPNPIAVQGR